MATTPAQRLNAENRLTLDNQVASHAYSTYISEMNRVVEKAVRVGLELALYADRTGEVVPPAGYDRGDYGVIESCVDSAVREALVAYFRAKVEEADDS